MHNRNAVLVLGCGLVALLGAFFNVGVARGEEPIAFPPAEKIYTREMAVGEIAAYEARLATAYGQQTKDPQQVRKDAAQLILDHQQSRFPVDAPDMTPLLARAEALMKQGSGDPLILAIAAECMMELKRPPRDVLALCKRAEDAVDASTYGVHERAEVRMRTYGIWYTLDGRFHVEKGYREARAKAAMDAAFRWLSREGENDHDQRSLFQLFEFFLLTIRESESERAGKLAAESHGINAWMQDMLIGREAFRQARLTGRLEPNDEISQKAYEHFLSAWKYKPSAPEAASYLITLGQLGYGDKSATYWFNQAVAAQFDFSLAYENYLTTLRPSRGGTDPGALYRFGIACARTGRYDTRVPFELTSALLAMDTERGKQRDDAGDVYRQPGVYEAVKDLCEQSRGAKIFNGRAQSERTRSWITATQIAVAARSQKYEDLPKLWPLATDADVQRAFWLYKVAVTPAEMRAKTAVIVNNVPAAALEVEFDRVDNAAAAVAALAKLDAAFAKVPKEADHAWYETWKRSLEMRRDLFSDKWVAVPLQLPAPPAKGIEGWTCPAVGTLESRVVTQLPLDSIAHIKMPLEYSLDVQTIEMGKGAIMAGLLLGSETRRPDGTFGLLFGVNSQARQAGATNGMYAYSGNPTAAVNHLAIRAWPGHFELMLNLERLVSQYNDDFSPAGKVALWTTSKPGAKVHVVYSNLKIRRMPENPPPLLMAEQAEERIAYFTQLLTRDPEDFVSRSDRADTYYFAEKFAESLADYELLVKQHPDSPALRALMGMSALRAGQYHFAAAAFQRALAKNPNQQTAIKGLAWLSATCPDATLRDGKKGVELITRGIQLSAKGINEDFKIVLAAAQAEQGEFDKAKASIRSINGNFMADENMEMSRKVMAALTLKKPYRLTPPVGVVDNKVPEPEPAHAEPPKALAATKVLHARFGGGKKWADVTPLVQKVVQNGDTVWATPNFLHADPTPGWRKHLEISFQRNGKNEWRSIDEGRPWNREDYAPQ